MRKLTPHERNVVLKAIALMKAGDTDFACNAVQHAANNKREVYEPILKSFERATNPRPANAVVWFGSFTRNDNRARRIRALRAMLIEDRVKRIATMRTIKAQNKRAIRRDFAE